MAGTGGEGLKTEAGGLLRGGQRVTAGAERANNVLPDKGTNILARVLNQSGSTTVGAPQPQEDLSQAPEQSMQGTGLGNPFAADQQQTETSPYSQANLIQDIQRDPKNADEYMAIYKQLNPAPSTANTVKPTAQQVGLGREGELAISQLLNEIQSNPSSMTKSGIPGQNLPLVGGFLSNLLGTGKYKNASASAAAAIGHLQSGAALTSQEKKMYEQQFIPRAGDSPEVVQQKLSALMKAFSPYASQQIGAGSVENSLAQ